MTLTSNSKAALLYPSAAIVALVPLASCNTAKDTGQQKPMNIVYIMTDDHTAQMMSCYDTRFADTPNLDRIARDGVRFTNAFVANSLSGPSRACLFTGKHSHKNGFTDNTTCVFDGSQPTFPKYLQGAGYETAIFGKWHLESLPTGFDRWEIVPGQGDYYNPDFILQTGDTVVVPGYLTDLITDKSLDWLENEHDPDKPFFLAIHHKAIHRNWMADSCHLGLYEDRTFPMPENFFDDYDSREAASTAEMRVADHLDEIYDLKMNRADKHSPLKERYESYYNRMDSVQKAAWDAHYEPIIEEFYSSNLQGKELAEWKYQRYIKDYLKVVKSLDENVGRVLDYLEEHDMLDNTLVVYTSDQGFYMGEHGWFDKRFMYEESFRTPLIMLPPKSLKRRGDIPEMVQNIDFAPTFMELAGVEIPDDIQGESLVPLLKDETPDDWRNTLYYHFYEYPAEHMVKRHYGVRDNRYKLIHFYNDIDRWELFDLQEDPKEMTNIYGQPGTEAVTADMMQKLKAAQEQYDDPIRFTYPIDPTVTK